MNEKLKSALMSILIGATIAFLSSLFDGLLDLLKGNGNNVIGAIGGIVAHSNRAKTSWIKTTPYNPV